MLTVKAIEAATPKAKPYKLSDGQGLYLEVMPSGAKYWRLKYRIAGKEKRISTLSWFVSLPDGYESVR